MLELIVLDQFLGLSVLAAAWPAQEEEDVRLGEETLGIGLLLHRKRGTCEVLQPIKVILQSW